VSRVLGIDLGERRIGLAVGETGGDARPLAVLARRTVGADAERLARLAREQDVTELVVGLPLNSDASEGPQARATRDWASALAELLGLPVILRDERWTSQDAEARLGPAKRGRSGGPPSRAALVRHRGAVDREAARRILQAELDARARSRP
jgi:putative Holliday junction resolvase